MENTDVINTTPALSPSSRSSSKMRSFPALAQIKDKSATISPAAKQQNLNFLVLAFFDDDLELWFWQLESTFVVR